MKISKPAEPEYLDGNCYTLLTGRDDNGDLSTTIAPPVWDATPCAASGNGP
jgi:hypothetical protein